MSVKLGLDAKLYRNTGNYASPNWQEMKNVKDLTLSVEAGEADATTRGNAGWKATLGMAVFGLTMAFPFVMLALLPGRVKALPKSGAASAATI